MTYQLIYLVGKTKNNNIEHQVEVEAEDAHNAIQDFRMGNPEAKVFLCVEKKD